MRASDVGALKDLLKSATFRTDEKVFSFQIFQIFILLFGFYLCVVLSQSVPLSPALQSLLHCSRVILSQSNTNAATEVSNLLQNAAAIFDFTIDSCLEHVSSASNAAKLNIGLQERDFAHQLHAFFTAKHNTARDIRLNMSLFLASLGRQMNGNLRLLWLARFCGLQLPDGLLAAYFFSSPFSNVFYLLFFSSLTGLEHVSAHISSVNEAAKAFLALWHRCAYKLNSGTFLVCSYSVPIWFFHCFWHCFSFLCFEFCVIRHDCSVDGIGAASRFDFCFLSVCLGASSVHRFHSTRYSNLFCFCLFL
jgi:hypothetical protein